MSLSLAPSLLIAPLVDFIVGKIIEAGAGGTPAKLVANAQELIAVNTAITEINAGNPAGVTALAAALQTSSLSPGSALALQSVLATMANQLSLLSNVTGSTLLGQANTVILTELVAAGTATANAYVTKYGTPVLPAG